MCDTPDGLAQLQYVLIMSGATLEIETATDGLHAVSACRYSPEDQPVLLKGRPMDEGVVVSVTDHGEGMARQTASKAFEEPFSAGEDILREERAGVGLHLARQLVVQHSGILWADPLPSGGTRVSFVIPVHEGDHLGRPEGLGSDPLDELHSLSETNP